MIKNYIRRLSVALGVLLLTAIGWSASAQTENYMEFSTSKSVGSSLSYCTLYGQDGHSVSSIVDGDVVGLYWSYYSTTIADQNFKVKDKFLKLKISGSGLTKADLSNGSFQTHYWLSDNDLTEVVVNPNNENLLKIDLSQNKLKGSAMDAFISSLPDRTGKGEGEIMLMDSSGENNVCYIEQVAAMKAKNWVPYSKSGSYSQPYEGTINPANGATITFKSQGTSTYVAATNLDTHQSIYSGDVVVKGINIKFMAMLKASSGQYELKNWTVNGETVDLVPNSNPNSTLSLLTITADDNCTVYANYGLPGPTTYVVNFAAEPVEGGSVSATLEDAELTSGTEVEETKSVVFTATPKDGYKLDKWVVNDVNSDVTELTLTETISQATTVKALFVVLPNHAVTFSSADESQGSVSAQFNSADIATGDELKENSEVVFTATPADGFMFDKWVVDGVDSDVTEATLTHKLLAATAVVAHFKPLPSYAVTFASTDEAQGTVTAQAAGAEIATGDAVQQGKKVVFTAVPAEGFIVDKWVVDGQESTSTDLKLALVISAATSVQVSFKEAPKAVVTFVVNPDAQGTLAAEVEGATINSGDEVIIGKVINFTLTLTDEANYSLQKWTVNGTAVDGATAVTYDYTVAEQNEVVAVVVVEKVLPTFAITFVADPAEAATVTATAGGEAIQTGTEVEQGTEVTLTAEVSDADAYEFEGWYNGAELLIQDPVEPTITVSVDQAMEIVAKYTVLPTEFEITFSSADNAQGAVTASYKGVKTDSPLTAKKKTNVIFYAIPAEGYELDYWMVNGVKTAVTSLTYDLYVAEKTDVVAYFKPREEAPAETQYTVTYAVANEHATIAAEYLSEPFVSGGKVLSARRIEISVMTDTDYVVDYWTVNGERVPNYKLTNDKTMFADAVLEDMDVKVFVKFEDYPVNFIAESGVGGTVIAEVEGEAIESGAIVKKYKEVTFTTERTNPAFIFDGWMVDGEKLEGYELTLTVQVLHEVDVMALYIARPDGYEVTYSQPDNGTLSATNNDEPIHSGSIIALEAEGVAQQVVFTAVPAEGFQVAKWIKVERRTVGVAQEVTVEETTVDVEDSFLNDDKTVCTLDVTCDFDLAVVLEPAGPKGGHVTWSSNADHAVTLNACFTANYSAITQDQFISEGTQINISCNLKAGAVFNSVTVNGSTVDVKGFSGYYYFNYTVGTEDVSVVWDITAPAPNPTHKVNVSSTVPDFVEKLSIYTVVGYSYTKINSGSDVEEGTKLSLEIECKEGYKVTGLTINGASTTSYYPSDYVANTFMVTANVGTEDVNAVWTVEKDVPQVDGTLTFSSTDPEGTLSMVVESGYDNKKVDSGTQVAPDTRLYITIEPKSNYKVTGLTINGEEVTDYNTSMTSSKCYIVKFMPKGNMDIVWKVESKDPTPVGDGVLTYSSTNTEGTYLMKVENNKTWDRIDNGSQVEEGVELWIEITTKKGYSVTGLTINDEPVTNYTQSPYNDQRFYLKRNMPAGDLNIVWTVEKEEVVPVESFAVNLTVNDESLANSYSIFERETYKNLANGTEVATGTKLGLEVVLNSGCEVEKLTVNGEEITSYSVSGNRVVYRMNMPAEALNAVYTLVRVSDPVQTYKVSTTVNDPDAGYMSIYDGNTYDIIVNGSMVEVGKSLEFDATAYDGYVFKGFKINGGELITDFGDFYGSFYIMREMLDSDMTVEGVFYKDGEEPTQDPTLTYSSTNSDQVDFIGAIENGSATRYNSGDAVAAGTMLKLECKPKTGYKVTGLTINGEAKSGYHKSSFSGKYYIIVDMTSDDLDAVWQIDEDKPEPTDDGVLTYKVTPAEGGKLMVLDGATYNYLNNNEAVSEGTSIFAQVTVKEGYELVSFNVNGNIRTDFTENPQSPGSFYILTTMTKEDFSIIVNLEKKEAGCVITYEQPEHGTVTATLEGEDLPSGSTVAKYAKVVLTVVPEDGYVVEKWVQNDVMTVDDNKLSDNKTVCKPFIYKDSSFKVILKESGETPDEGHAVTFTQPEHGKLVAKVADKEIKSGDRFPVYTTVKFQVIPDEGYEVDYWTNNNMRVGSIYLMENMTMYGPMMMNDIDVAVFLKPVASAKDFTVNFSSNDEAAGIVKAVADDPLSTGDKVAEGTEVTFIAIANNGYEFDKWTIDGADAGITEMTMKQTITADVDVVAHFKLIDAIDAVSAASVKVYPNPTVDYVIVEGVEANAQVAVYSANGAVVAMVQADADGQARIDVSRLVAGNYLVKVCAVTKNLIVK